MSRNHCTVGSPFLSATRRLSSRLVPTLLALAVVISLVPPHSASAQEVEPRAGVDEPRTYVVKGGDTLYRIALNHGTTVAAIQRLNNIQGTSIEVGQTIVLRADEPATEEEGSLFMEVYGGEADSAVADVVHDADPPRDAAVEIARPIEVVIDPVAASDAFDVYPARRRDTFEALSQRLRIPAGVLRALNPDVSQPMSTGTEIRLPIEASLLLYSVKDGDTVEGIAATFGTSAEAITEENALKSSTLRIGLRLRIPIEAGRAEGESPTTGEVVGGADSQQVAGGVAAAARSESAGGGLAQNRSDEPDIQSAPVAGAVRIYPPLFEGRIMANGKAYEAKRFTISHATLALGTVVLLTNEVTGRKTFAEVTDRPPSDADYLLDVSRSVADVLGLAENGGKVTVQVAG